MNGSARISVANLRDMAVLPCRHPGLAADELYVADQWSAELIDKIAQTGVIRPRPWQAVSRYRNVRVGDSSIASELGAGSVLHCEFSDDPGTLRLVFALFRAADGRRIWTRAYDQPAGPVGASELQALVVSDLAGSLGLAIAPELQRRLARPPTRDSTAWRLYRLARHLLQEVDDQRALTVSARYFRQALELDTSFARAYVGLAEAELWRGHQTSRPSRETYPRVATLVLEGLQRDPLIAEAHSLLARYFFEFTYDWPSAEAEHRRALALNPNSADARHTYGLHLTLRERYREAVAELDRAHQLDPANSLVRGNLARALWFAGEERRAQRELRDGMEIDPRWAPYYHHLALILLNRHQPDSAVALLDRSGDRQLWNAWLYAVAGRPAAARAYLDSLLASDDDADPAAIAWMHIALGQEREALEWLERAYAERSAFVLWLAGPHPAFNPLRRHPRFRELRRRVGLPA